jgi:hypothetical protein
MPTAYKISQHPANNFFQNDRKIAKRPRRDEIGKRPNSYNTVYRGGGGRGPGPNLHTHFTRFTDGRPKGAAHLERTFLLGGADGAPVGGPCGSAV